MNFLGSLPNGLTEWQCESCGRYFDFLERDAEANSVVSDPKFCPLCGAGETK